MNLKFEHNAIRFRITADELTSLREGRRLEEAVKIGGTSFKYTIDPAGEGDTLRSVLVEEGLGLVVSPRTVQRLADLGRSREGLEEISEEGTQISLQVDFRTQKTQRSSARHQAS